jgi:hypothetical protein
MADEKKFLSKFLKILKKVFKEKYWYKWGSNFVFSLSERIQRIHVKRKIKQLIIFLNHMKFFYIPYDVKFLYSILLWYRIIISFIVFNRSKKRIDQKVKIASK